MTNATYFVPTENAPKLKARLDTLIARASKLGVAALTYVVVKTIFLPTLSKGELLECEALTICGEAPQLNGWVFIGTIQHETAKDGRTINVLRTHGEEDVPGRFRTATPDHCDHCGTMRDRKDTYIVRNVESGEFKQVGRTCIKDFLGHGSVDGLAKYATLLLSLDDVVNESCGEGGGREPCFDLRTFLALVVRAIDADGWVSRTKARELEHEGIMATCDYVLGHLNAKTDEARRTFAISAPTADTYIEVDEALEWLAGEADSDYIHNCGVIAELGAVKYRTAGYAASIVSSHRRSRSQSLVGALGSLTPTSNTHVGVEGKRGEMKLTLLAVIGVDGFYGMTYIHKFMDENGAAVVWFASNPWIVKDRKGGDEDERMVEGASYVVKATVKKHGDYEGTAQTTVTRLAVQPLTKVKKARRARKAKAASAEA